LAPVGVWPAAGHGYDTRLVVLYLKVWGLGFSVQSVGFRV
jgi:hypothetical protein